MNTVRLREQRLERVNNDLTAKLKQRNEELERGVVVAAASSGVMVASGDGGTVTIQDIMTLDQTRQDLFTGYFCFTSLPVFCGPDSESFLACFPVSLQLVKKYHSCKRRV